MTTIGESPVVFWLGAVPRRNYPFPTQDDIMVLKLTEITKR